MTFEMPAVLKEPKLAAMERLVIRLTGETGVGKSFSAKKIHDEMWSGRPFVAVSLAELGDGNLMKYELFGIEPKVIHGVDARVGAFRRADGGTLFIDEFQEVPPEVQVLLLTVLQERVVRPIGGDEPRQVDVRLIIGSQVPLDVLVAQGRLRLDVLQRLRRGPAIALPPLRALDEPRFRALSEAFATEAGLSAEVATPLIDALWSLTQRHPERAWPGNIRELDCTLASRVWLPHEQALSDVRRIWLQGTPQRGRSATPTGHWMAGDAREDDILLLEALLKAVLATEPGKAGPRRAGARHAQRLAELLVSKRRRGIPADWLADVLGYKQGKGFEQLVGDLAAAGMVEVVEREMEVRESRSGDPGDEVHRRTYETTRYLIPIWPLARVDAVVLAGGRELPWSPHIALTGGDRIEVRIQVAFSCDVKVAIASHSTPGSVAIDVDFPSGLITTTPGVFARWNLPIDLDSHIGWEQVIVHIRPRIDRPPTTERGGTSGTPHSGQRGVDPSARAAQLEAARDRWGEGWMTDWVIRKL